MTIDEAIKHAEEVADVCGFEARKYDMTDAYERYVACQDGKCAEEHRQLAEWLKELKQLKKQTSSGREAHTEDKDLICKELAKLLKLTRNQSDLKALKYEILDNGEEIVTVEWESGGRKVVGVSMDSGTAMIRDIMRAID